MLQRGGVEHDLRPELLEDLLDPARVADVGEHRPVGFEQRATVQVQLHRVQRRLVAVQQDQIGRVEPVQLTAQLGSDGTPGAGNQDPLALEVTGDRGDVGLHRRAAEQVADPRIPHPLDPLDPAEQLGDRRDHLGHQATLLGLGG